MSKLLSLALALAMTVLPFSAFAEYDPSDFPTPFVGEWIVGTPTNTATAVVSSGLPAVTESAMISVWFRSTGTNESGLFNAYDGTINGGMSCALNFDNYVISAGAIECYISAFGGTTKRFTFPAADLGVAFNDSNWHNLIVGFDQGGASPTISGFWLDGVPKISVMQTNGALGLNDFAFDAIYSNDSLIASEHATVQVQTIRMWNDWVGLTLDGRNYIMEIGESGELIPSESGGYAGTESEYVGISSTGAVIKAKAVNDTNTANGYFLKSSFEILDFLGALAVLAGGLYVLNKIFSFVPTSRNDGME